MTRLWLALVAVLFCLPLFVGLGRADVQNDEAIYSFAADTIVRSGGWMTPKSIPSEHEAFLEKPPLKFWIVAAPIRLGLLPHNEFGLRFWDALFGGVAFLYVFAIGRRLAGPLCGLIAVAILFFEQALVFEHGLRTNNMEAALFLCYCGAIHHFLAWRDGGTPRRRYAHAFGVTLYFVLGFMTKFVAALFLPMVLAAAVLLGGDVRRFWRDRLAWLAAGLVALALIAPWFLYQNHQFGRSFWAVILGQHVFTRFTASLDPQHVHPWHYYFTQIVEHFRGAGTLPVVVAGLVLLVARATRRVEPVLLLWFALPLALMSLGTSKLYHYAYPFLPPLALAGGYACAAAFRFCWSAMTQPWPAVRRLVTQTTARGVQSRRLRLVLLSGAAFCVALAVATYFAGVIRLHIGSVTLLRNATVARPALIAMLLAVLAGRLVYAVRVATVMVLVFVLPGPDAYGRQIHQLRSEQHPLRSLRDCLQPVSARLAGAGRPGAGVWAADEEMTWPVCYYLRGLGPWDKQDSGPDAVAYMDLYAPDRLRPVILSYTRYQSLMQRVRAQDEALIQEVARTTGRTPAVLSASASDAVVVPVRLPDGVLLLPGPYAACGIEHAIRERDTYEVSRR